MKQTSKSKSNSKLEDKRSLLSRWANLGRNKIDDITNALMEDHKQLRKLGEILKSEDATDKQKKTAYKNFSSLLKSHADSEETALYNLIAKKENTAQEAQEGFTEHKIAADLMKEIAGTRDKTKWNAKVKVLAEVVEHHADEEEREMLPQVDDDFKKEDRKKMAHQFISLRERSQKSVSKENAGILAEVKKF